MKDKLFLLNKALHGCDIYYEVALPSVFLLVHPLGTVLGRASRMFGPGRSVALRDSHGRAVTRRVRVPPPANTRTSQVPLTKVTISPRREHALAVTARTDVRGARLASCAAPAYIANQRDDFDVPSPTTRVATGEAAATASPPVPTAASPPPSAAATASHRTTPLTTLRIPDIRPTPVPN